MCGCGGGSYGDFGDAERLPFRISLCRGASSFFLVNQRRGNRRLGG
jgi:hypothetical protein